MKKLLDKYWSLIVVLAVFIIPSVAIAINVADLWPTSDNKFSLGKTGQVWKEILVYDATISDDLVVADDASIGGDLTITGAIVGGTRTVTAKTASYTLTTSDSGNVITTVGAAADLTITTLAASAEGFNVRIINGTTNNVFLVPAGGATVGATGTYATTSTLGASSEFIGYSPSAGAATKWSEIGDFTVH